MAKRERGSIDGEWSKLQRDAVRKHWNYYPQTDRSRLAFFQRHVCKRRVYRNTNFSHRVTSLLASFPTRDILSIFRWWVSYIMRIITWHFSFSYRILCVSNVSIPSRRRMAAKQTSNIEISPSTMAITAADHVKPIDVSVIHLNNVKH